LNKFYGKEGLRRTELLIKVNENKNLIAATMEMCSQREHIIDFMVDWCWTFDPRNAALGLPTTLPWVPWPKQIEFIEWVYNRYLNREGGFVEKARDAGATFLFCFIMLREWRFSNGFSAGIGSNKLENVDKRDNPKSIFSKLRTIMYNLPQFWFPIGYERKRHDNVANLINPENFANISGEDGDDIGRGDRRSMYFVDEAASLEHPEGAMAALSRTTDSCFYLSTPKGMNFYGRQRHSGKHKVFTFDWKSDPRINEEWFAHFAAANDPVIVAQEVLIDYNASVEGICIPKKWINASVNLELNHTGGVVAGLDVAVGGKNKSAYVERQGPTVIKCETWNFDNTNEVANRAVEAAEHSGVCALGYDSVGVGEGVRGALKAREQQPKFRYYALGGNDAVSDTHWDQFQKMAKEVFLNARAERWYKVRRRFERTYQWIQSGRSLPIPHSEMISIPNDPELIQQLASPLEMRTESGKIKIESKEHMLARGIASPDKADALVYAYAVDFEAIGDFLFYGFDYTPKYDKVGKREKFRECYTDFRIDWGIINNDQHRRRNNIGSTYFDKGMGVNHISAYWNPYKAKLYIYDAFVIENRPPEYVARQIKQSMSGCIKARTIYCEENPSRNPYDGVIKAYRKEGVLFAANPRFDPISSIYVTNQMFVKRQIIVHEKLDECKRQFSLWGKDGMAIRSQGFGLCIALCNIVNLLKEQGELEEHPHDRGYTATPPKRPDEQRPAFQESNVKKKPIGMGDMFGD